MSHTTTQVTAQIFLSWASRDRTLAEKLWSRLGEALAATAGAATTGQAATVPTYSLWSFTEQLVVGDRWDDRIRSALDQSVAGLLAVSNAFLTSSYIQQVELPHFIADTGKPILPVLLDHIPEHADLRGLEPHQIFGFDRPFSACRTRADQVRFANDLTDQVIRHLGNERNHRSRS